MSGLPSNPLHPKALYLDLPQACAGIAGPGLPDSVDRLRCVLNEGDGETLAALGWRLVKRTCIRAVPVRESDARSAPPGTALLPLPDDRSLPIWSDWAEAHWRHYRATHADNPPVLTPEGTRGLFLGDDLAPGDAVALMAGDELAGFASLRAVDGARAEAGWIAAPGLAGGLAALWSWIMARARVLGVEAVELEVDDTDEPLWAFLVGLPDGPEERYVIWEVKVKREPCDAED